MHAWLKADEPVVIEMRATLQSLRETATFRRNTGGIFGTKVKAATLPGFTLASGKKPGGKPGKQQEKEAIKKERQKAAGKAVASANKGAPSKGTSGSTAKKKRVFPYENGDFSIGTP